MTDLDPKVYVVSAYQPSVTDFAICGVYSKKGDAEDFKRALMEEPETLGAVMYERLRMSTVMALLAKNRLLAVATVLDHHITDMEDKIAALIHRCQATIPEVDHAHHAFSREAAVHSCNPGGDPVRVAEGQDGDGGVEKSSE